MRQATDGKNLPGQPLITRFIPKVFTLRSSSSSTSFATAANTTTTSAAAAAHRDTQQLAQPESGATAGMARVESVRIHLPEPAVSKAAMVPLSHRSHPEPALPRSAGANPMQSRFARARAGYTAIVRQAVLALVRHDSSGARHALANVWTGAQSMVELLEGPGDVDADSGSGSDSDSDSGADVGSDPGTHADMLNFAAQALEGVPLERLLKIQDAMRASGTELSPASFPGLPNYSPALAPGPVDRRDQSDLGRWLMVQAVDGLVNILTPRQHVKKATTDAIRLFEEIDGSDAGMVEKLCSYSTVHEELHAVCARLVARWPALDGDLEARVALDDTNKRARQGADALMDKGQNRGITEPQTAITAPSP
jgi:hypothetical protein